MAETKAPETTPIESVLENESESETKVEVDGPKDKDSIVAKAEAKLAMMNIPTDRKTQEDLAKMVSQINSAEEQKAVNIQQGTVHPEHQTFGILGVPMAAAVHDYELDKGDPAQGSVKTKRAEDDKAVKEHNESLARIRENLEKENGSK